VPEVPLELPPPPPPPHPESIGKINAEAKRMAASVAGLIFLIMVLIPNQAEPGPLSRLGRRG